MPITLVFSGCASTINHDIYAVKDDHNPIIEVMRDTKTAPNIKANNNAEGCPTNFYINQIKVGSFATKNISNYQLVPGNYRFAVDNCQGRCSAYGLDVEIKQGEHQKFTLSVDASGQPFIISTKIK